MAVTHFKGEPVSLLGNEINIGDQAPLVKVVSSDLEDIEIGGKAQILAIVPSLDTPVCAAETIKFNIAAVKTKAEVIVVSIDLPFAAGRFCTTEGIENLKVGSDFRNKEFLNSYGVLIGDGILAGLGTRAIFVINDKGTVIYKEICNEITEEPDYDAALSAAKQI